MTVIRIAPPWFLSCTTHCKFTSLVPPLYHSCATIVSLVVFRSGRALGASGHGVKRSWLGALQCLQPAATQSFWQETAFNSSRWKFFSPSSLGNQDTFPLGALHRVEEKSLYSVGGRGPWGRLRMRCHHTRGLGSGRPSSSPQTFCPACWGRACMGTWGGRAAGASGRSWAWFDVFLTGETFPNKSWRAWWASGKSCTALKRKKKQNPEWRLESYKSQLSWDKVFIRNSILMRGNNSEISSS